MASTSASGPHPVPAGAGSRPTLRSFEPRTGRAREEIPANTKEEVRAAVHRARSSQPAWGALGPARRGKVLAEVRHLIAQRMDHLVEVVASETGKPPTEALTHDVLPTVLTLRYLASIGPRALAPRTVGRLISPVFGMRSRIEWRPVGVVGCITPWNYPLLLSFMAMTPALVAGNAVVLKPSEVTPATGELIREVLSPLPDGVVSVMQGGAEVGTALVDAPCDKICFIGSTATGRRIVEVAARHLTPVILELGGQDAAIVCRDADLDLATSGVLWGAFMNAGQACCAIERVYVEEPVVRDFESAIAAKLRRVLEAGDIGPITSRRQLDTVERHVRDAVERGARILAGGPPGQGRPQGSTWFPPTILEGRTRDMALFGQETFGPVLPVVPVRDVNEAVRRANRDGFNLTASVWTGDPGVGRAVAARLRAGSVSVNDHGSTAGAPWGLWGGVGESGYGRLHGAMGIREFSVPVHMSENLFPGMKRPWWYPYDGPTTSFLRAATEVLAGGDPVRVGRAMLKVAGSLRRVLRSKI